MHISFYLTPPSRVIFYISVILTVLAFVGEFKKDSLISDFKFWFAAIAAVLLILFRERSGAPGRR